VRAALAEDAALASRVATRFGLPAAGPLDRRRLAQLVFADPTELAALEALVHPVVADRIRVWRVGRPDPWVACEAIKLLESGLAAQCDAVWLVLCDRAERLSRLSAAGWDPDEVTRRMSAAPALAPELAAADALIDNSGPWDHTLLQLEAAWAKLA
jgi:dephospho-CoA kinase